MDDILNFGPTSSYDGLTVIPTDSYSKATITLPSENGEITLTLKNVEIVEFANGDLEPEDGLPAQNSPHFISVMGILLDEDD